MTDADRDRLAILVHEVRSSVAALSAIAETYPQVRDDLTANRSLIELALAASRGIARIVADATVASVRKEPVDVGRLVEDAVTAAVLGGGNVRAEIAPTLPVLEADPVRLRQALDNLVSNAFVHSGSSDEVVVRVRDVDASVVISVVDTGSGVPLSEHERIFEQGVRLDDARPGSGIGLALARAIAEAHGGTLTVESAAGPGAIFAITLPVL